MQPTGTASLVYFIGEHFKERCPLAWDSTAPDRSLDDLLPVLTAACTHLGQPWLPFGKAMQLVNEAGFSMKELWAAYGKPPLRRWLLTAKEARLTFVLRHAGRACVAACGTVRASQVRGGWRLLTAQSRTLS